MKGKLPNHIAIIMDGNGRWASNRYLPRTMGHREGAKALQRTVEYFIEIGIKYLTVYAFSTENWNRSEKEVNMLMNLFEKYIKNEEKQLMENNTRFMVSGSSEKIPETLITAIKRLEHITKDNSGMVLNIAFNYGGRQEIVDAVNKILNSDKKVIDEKEFRKYLYNDIPDPELVIRSSGELRISNFLLWQIAYSEFYITDVLWPDFDKKELDKALESFTKRERRFGGKGDEK